MDSLNVPLPDPLLLPKQLRESPHWIVWKAERRGDKIAKVPCDNLGRTESMLVNHRRLDEALEAARSMRHGGHLPIYGVGLSFVDGMGFVGVDLDGAIVNGARAEHLSWMLREYPTWAEVSLSGVGAHLFYLGKFDGKRSAIIDGAKVEIFGSKGFIAVTGRAIPDTPAGMIDFAPLGDTLGPHLIKVPKPVTNRVGAYNPSVGNKYGQKALQTQCDRVRAAPNGQLHYTLCSAATSIGRLTPLYISFEQAEQALYLAAAEAGGKDMDAALRTIRGQLEFGATDPAHPVDRTEQTYGVDLSEFGMGIKIESVESEQSPIIDDPGQFPTHLLKVPGFIQQVTEFTNHNSFVLQPILALGGALSLLSVLTGRKVKTRDGVRTNIYILNVAGSGEGKDAARKTNKKVLYAAGAANLIGPESWASGSGLAMAVEKQPAVLFQNDEIGRFLLTTNDPKKSPHLFSVISILLKLYSSADDVYLGDAYADGRQKAIPEPHAVLLGTTVPGSLYDALTQDSITNGLMGRMFVFEAPDRQQPTQEPDTIDPPAEVVNTARKWFQWQPGAGNLQAVNPQPFVVPVDEDAEQEFRKLRTFGRDQRAILGDVMGSLWVRAVENARKLALLYACSENFGPDARVTVEAAKWACELTSYLVRRMVFTCSRFVARNEIESKSLAVERIIENSGCEGISKSDILKNTRHLSRRERDDILDTLVECGRVAAQPVATNGRPRIIYIPTSKSFGGSNKD